MNVMMTDSSIKCIGRNGGPENWDTIQDNCIRRMALWVEQAGLISNAEFPDFEIIQSFEVFHFPLEHAIAHMKADGSATRRDQSHGLKCHAIDAAQAHLVSPWPIHHEIRCMHQCNPTILSTSSSLT